MIFKTDRVCSSRCFEHLYTVPLGQMNTEIGHERVTLI
jgi:hypothetical protein